MGQPESVLLIWSANKYIHSPFLFGPKEEETAKPLRGLGVFGQDPQALYTRSASFVPPRSACRMPHIKTFVVL